MSKPLVQHEQAAKRGPQWKFPMLLAGVSGCLVGIPDLRPAFAHQSAGLSSKLTAKASVSASVHGPAPTGPSSRGWGAVGAATAVTLLAASRAGPHAKRSRVSVVRLANTQADQEQAGESPVPEMDATLLAAALAVVATVAIPAADAEEAAAVAETSAATVASAVADPAPAAAVAEAAAPAVEAAPAAAAAASDAPAAAAEAVQAAADAAADTAADVAGAAADVATAAADSGGGDWFDPWVNFNAGIIAGIDEVIEDRLMLPNTFGFAIILYTAIIKLLTFPLNQSSLRSNAMMQLLQPKVKQIQTKYKNDQETMNRMMLRLFDDCGVNPLGGCLPSLVQFPIFIGLYRAINRLAEKNPHFQEPFLWIPSLAGPVEIGKPSLDWLIKSQSEDHFEPMVGWENAGLYLILPVGLVASQFVTQKMSAPTQAGASGPLGAVVGFFPLIIGYTTMVSPAGLGVYWFMNNIFTQVQTQLIRNGLGEEFPEYKKVLDGTAEKEKEERKQRLAQKKEATEEVFQRGFAAQANSPPIAEVRESAQEEEEEKEVVPAYNPAEAAGKRAKRRRRSMSKRRRR